MKLSDGGEAVVPTLDVKTMLLSLLNDNSKMIVENIAPNYTLFIGKPIDPSNTNIGGSIRVGHGKKLGHTTAETKRMCFHLV